jgi:LysM repeat protein
VQHLHKFANMRRWTYSPKNINQVKYTMQGLAAIKEGLFEGYYGTRRVSYSGEPTEARLVIQHNRALAETDARFRYVESLFIETADAERFRLQFKNLAGGRAMLEHVRQGGKPYDVRGSHITEMVSEIATLSRFNRASAGRVLEGVTAELVTEAQQYYRSLRENLKRMGSSRGYQTYFESWHPAETTLQEELVDSIKTMFVEQTLDSRIEAALPVLARLQQENRMKEADIFESWAEHLSEGTWSLPETPEQQQRLQDLMSRELIVGPDATNATQQLDDLVGDDILFDRLSDLASRDASANVWDDTDVQARLAELGIQLPADPVADPAAQPVQQQPVTEGRVKELEMDIVDSLMSDEEFETKYGESRGVMARELGLVQDRKTGKFYNPDQEFDRLKNSPEFGAQMRRMSQRESALSDLPRPNKRNQFRSLHKLRKQRGLGEQGVAETALKDKEDLAAKRRALQDLSRNPGVDQKAVQQRQQDLEKEAKLRGIAEGVKSAANRRKIDESLLMEDPIYRSFKQIGRYIAERRMSEKEILQVFADAEAGMTNTAAGTNRTMLGRGKDRATDLAGKIKDSVNTVLKNIQDSVPVSAVDVAYDTATDALAGLAGGQKGQVMQAIKKYRMLVKKYPKSAGFAKAALVAITGLATGGAGLPAIAGLTYALDAAIKGEKLSSVLGKGAGAAALAWAGQSIAGAVSGGDSAAAGTAGTDSAVAGTDPVSNLVTPDKFPTADLPTYTVQSGDTLSQIAQDNGISVKELIGLNPQLADATGATGGQSMNPDVIFPGQEITLPPESGAGTYDGGVGTSAGTQADIAGGQIPNSEISQRLAGDVGATPSAGDAATTTSAAQAPAPTGSSNTFTGTMIANEPVVPGQPLSARQVAIVDMARGMGNSYSPEVMQSYNLAKGIKENSQIVAKIRESVQHKILPFEQLIDQKRTEMSWTLNESIGRKNNSFVLTTQGTYAVFENVERYRRAMIEVAGVPGSTRPEFYRPDMPGGATTPAAKKPGLLSRGLSRVGGALSTFGRQFTTNVTKEKLKMNWHQDRKPSDSDQLAAWLVTQGVPQDVVSSIYKKMSIPYAAPSTQLAPQPTAQPVTQPVLSPATVAPTAAKPAATTAAVAKPAATAPASFNAGNVMNLPGMEKYAKPTTPNYAGPSAYGKTTMGFKSPTAASVAATKQPTAPVPAPAATTPANIHAKKGPGPTAAEKDKFEKLVAQAKAKEMTESLLAEFAADLDGDNLAEDVVDDFLARGGEIQQGKFRRPRKSEKTDYGSRHIGTLGGGGKPSKVSGTAANTRLGAKPVVAVEASGCNHTMEGKMCPEHGLAECGMHESQVQESDAQLARLKSLALGQ